MVELSVFVEGGGRTNELRTACREAFRTFLTKAGILARPKIIARGSRNQAYESFCIAVAQGQRALLLVDSESRVAPEHQAGHDWAEWKPWDHLRRQDQWQAPRGAVGTDCHLMVVCMESWLIADRQNLEAFFGQGFRSGALPPISTTIESIDKDALARGLATATAHCKTKARYDKGAHSFKLLALIDPAKVTAASGWAARFIAELNTRMGN